MHTDVGNAAEGSTKSFAVVGLIALGAFALGMASYVTAGLIPLIEGAFSVPVSVAAQLVTAFTLAYGLGSPLCVAVLPARRRRTGLLWALGLFVAVNVASACAGSFAWLLFWRSLAGIGAGVYLALGIAASTAIVASGQRGRAIALMMGGMAGGTVLGVPLGLMLAQWFGWTAALWLVAVLGGLAWLGLWMRLPELPQDDPAVRWHDRLCLLRDSRVLGTLLVSLLAAVASLGLYTYLAALLLAVSPGGLVDATPWLWAWGAGGLLGSFLVVPLADRVAPGRLTLGIMVWLAVALAVTPFAAAWQPWLALLPVAVWGAVGWALQVPQNNLLVNERERQGDGDLAVALNESALYLGSALGAAGGGILLVAGASYDALGVAAGAVAAVGAALQVFNLRCARR
ncbi:MFS transporter [Alcaligenaceae bacterium SJ-26]|nr:MFS transporter [Alcaligenaceae bacterium SJ-26]